MKKGASVRVQNLQIDLGEFHLRDANLAIAAGEYFVILGPNGAGKTVLLEAIAGLQHLLGGHALMNGEDITDTAPESRSNPVCATPS